MYTIKQFLVSCILNFLVTVTSTESNPIERIFAQDGNSNTIGLDGDGNDALQASEDL